MSLTDSRRQIMQTVRSQGAELCAVTKNRSIAEVESLINDLPDVKIIAENRWPDCEEKFQHFQNIRRHFIGPLQSNKVRKVLPLVDMIESVDSFKLLERIERISKELNKKIDFTFQVNISHDPAKQGISPEDLPKIIEQYLQSNFQNVTLRGLMTIGAITQDPTPYFQELKQLFDKINKEFFPTAPLQTLSMGMSTDYEKALAAGATEVRIGSKLF